MQKSKKPLSFSPLKLLIARSITLYGALILLMFDHRFMSFTWLSSQLDVSKISRSMALSVGLLSDLWMSVILTLGFVILGMILMGVRFLARQFLHWPQHSPRRAFDRLWLIYLIIIVLATTLHQSYVEFFGFQIIPFHLTYMCDPLFIKANYITAFNPRSGFLIFIIVVAAYFFMRKRPFEQVRARYLTYLMMFLLLFSFAAHKMNLYYKVQKFIPTELQTNYLEHLSYQLRYPAVPPLPDSASFAALAKRLGVVFDPSDTVAAQLKQLLQPSTAASADPLTQRIRALVNSRAAAGKHPMIVVVLLESLRPSEVSFYHPSSSQPSITPYFDQLASSGITFLNAYSTGVVTRGAQEAVMCGHLGAIGTSMMRERSDIKMPCLPDLLSPAPSFFYHGGRGEFDSQEAFWRHHRMSTIITQSDYADEVPTTDWGVSDMALVERSIIELKKLSGSMLPHDTATGLILSVTNHIPWKLPTDMPAQLEPLMKELGQHHHPSHQTTAYMDAAIGRLIQQLKQEGLWQNTVLIISSDHGTSLPPYYNDQQQRPEPLAAMELLGHIVVILHGGIVEEALQTASVHDEGAPASRGIKITDYVSQAQIAPWIDYISGGLRTRYIQPMLLTKDNPVPIMVNTGTALYFPQEQVILTKEQILSAGSGDNASVTSVPLTYARAYFNLLNRLTSM